MKIHILLLLVGMFSLMVSCEPGVTYYVKPSQSTKCPGQPCETLNYYLKNVNTTINKEKNLTMIFLNGNHSLDSKILPANPVSIKTHVIRMVGESKNISRNGHYWKISCIVVNTNFRFINNSKIYLKELVLIDFNIFLASDQPTSTVHLLALKIFDSGLDIEVKVVMENTELNGVYISMNAYSVLKESKLYNTPVELLTGLILEIDSCNFLNSPLGIDRDATVTISGTTVFAGTEQISAITSFLGGTLTLSGNVTFANNSAKRGGALALYMSTLSIAANTTVTFMNNSANHNGGAIYVEPGISPNMVLNLEHGVYSTEYFVLESLPSFYELLNCNISNNKYNFHFVNNSAVNGGNDVYGALLTDSAYSCNLTVNISSPSNSSVSSDALRVCLCDKQGQPQCKNYSYLRMTSVIHPGETFKISAVLVGGDFGLTTGTIYADIRPDHYSITPSLVLVSEYSNIITKTNIAPQCREIEYRLYTRNDSFLMVYFAAVQIDNPPIPFQRKCEFDDACFRTSIVL